MVNPLELAGAEVMVIKKDEPEVPELPEMEETPKAPTPGIEAVPHGVRHAHALRQKAAVMPTIEAKKKRQKKSRGQLKKSITKPTSGRESLRPNRHASKRKKLEKH